MAGKGQGPAIGIDLGTSYSCVAVWKQNRVEIIPNDHGNRKTPSFVAFNETHRLIGHEAMDQAAMNPTDTIYGASLVFTIFRSRVLHSEVWFFLLCIYRFC
jgi:heat shock protein 1/8